MFVKNSGERSQELVSWDHLGRKEREKSSIAWPGSGQKKYPPKFFFKFRCFSFACLFFVFWVFFFWLFVFNLAVPSLSCGIWDLVP